MTEANGRVAPTSKERDTDLIVRAALELYAERGPARVSLREVAQRAGVNYGLIHQYVGTKEQLLGLVFERSSTSWTGKFAEAGDLDSAVGLLLRPKSDAYVRMLAHVILEGRDPSALLTAPPALRELTRRLESAGGTAGTEAAIDTRIQVAALTAMSMGWGLFGRHLRVIADLTDLDEAELETRVYDYLRRVFSTAGN